MSAATEETAPPVGLRPGPKRTASTAPLDLSELPRRDHRRVYAFAREFLTVPKGKGARNPFLLRPWQREIARGLYPSKGPRPRQGLVSLPRGNGKSTLAAVLALYALYADEVEGPQVLTVASDLRQASIIFNAARRMVETSPRLAAITKVYQDKLVVPSSDGLLMPLPAEPSSLQGWDPSACIVDELHVVNREVWESMTLASGKRDRSMVLAISTPAASEASIMWDLVQLGRSAEDPSFYFREWTSDPAHPTDCAHCWEESNPALDDFLSRDAMSSVRRTSREGSYRRFRLGQWLDAAEDQWVTPAQWEACSSERSIPDGAEVVIGFDGSFSMDATAIVAATVSQRPHLQKVRVWEPPQHKGSEYRIPIADVEDEIRKACRRWKVREVVCDPYRYAKSMQELAAERLPMIEHPQHPARMTPATIGLYEAICNQQVTHDGDADMRRHFMNARVTEDARGTRIHKAGKDSPAKVDLAVASIMAHARAVRLANTKRKGRVLAW